MNCLASLDKAVCCAASCIIKHQKESTSAWFRNTGMKTGEIEQKKIQDTRSSRVDLVGYRVLGRGVERECVVS